MTKTYEGGLLEMRLVNKGAALYDFEKTPDREFDRVSFFQRQIGARTAYGGIVKEVQHTNLRCPGQLMNPSQFAVRRLAVVCHDAITLGDAIALRKGKLSFFHAGKVFTTPLHICTTWLEFHEQLVCRDICNFLIQPTESFHAEISLVEPTTLKTQLGLQVFLSGVLQHVPGVPAPGYPLIV